MEICPGSHSWKVAGPGPKREYHSLQSLHFVQHAKLAKIGQGNTQNKYAYP